MKIKSSWFKKLTKNRVSSRIDHFFDLRFVRWYTLGEYQQQWYLKKILPLLEIDLLIDVGGNEGQFARFVRSKLNFKGKLVTFEPIPELAANLRKISNHDPNWIIVNEALGDEVGKKNFNVTSSSPMSSLLTPSNDSTDLLNRFNSIDTAITVDVNTLDNFLSSRTDLREYSNIYLKLDVQGYEKKVLEGATKSLAKIQALQAELAVTPIYKDQPEYQEMLKFLEESGYTLSFVPAHNYSHFPELIDFDCHFIQKRRLNDIRKKK